MKFRYPELFALLLALIALLPVSCSTPAIRKCANPPPPEILRTESKEHSLVTLPDGSVAAFFVAEKRELRFIPSTDGGRTWGDPQTALELAQPGGSESLTGLMDGGARMLVDRDGELHAFYLSWRGEGKRLAEDRFLDIWHCRSHAGRTRWTKPKRIYEGYCGAILDVTQLRNGRIVLPFAFWVAGRASAPPTGSNISTVLYSDDGGATWTISDARLTSPCHTNYNGSNYGAIEPTVIQLKDGRAWMLLRTQTGVLYESFSDDGANWSEARPSRFRSSNSPAEFVRLPDGCLVLIWNNCEMPPRVNGQGVYGGRDAIHAAISDNDGKTWRGFREIYRDPTRNQTPPRTGDRGTAYPTATALADGTVLVLTGQGEKPRVMLRLNPDWLLETGAADDFSNGLEQWSVFKGVGPAQRWWRDRVQGPQLVPHPDKVSAHALHIRRPDNNDPDGAVWNFPAGRSGRLTMRVRLWPGFGGASIALGDRFFDPTDPAGETEALFLLAIDSSGQLPGGMKLEQNRWHELEFNWQMERKRCEVRVDGKPAATLPLRQNAFTPGASYLRLRSTAEKTDTAGFLVESVTVQVR